MQRKKGFFGLFFRTAGDRLGRVHLQSWHSEAEAGGSLSEHMVRPYLKNENQGLESPPTVQEHWLLQERPSSGPSTLMVAHNRLDAGARGSDGLVWPPHEMHGCGPWTYM